MNEKLLSIIIPSFNIEKYIEKAVTSLLVDELNSLDILIINDGSTDKTLSLAKKYEKLYPKVIRVINKNNGNYGSCINIGLAEARGKFIKILDGDDYFDINTFSVYLGKLSNIDDSVDMVLTNYQIVDSNGFISKVIKMNVESDCIIPVRELPCVAQLQHHGITYRVDRLRKIGYKQTEGISYTDQEWISIPLFIMRNAFYFDISPLYCYLLGRAGQTMDQKVIIKKVSNMVQVLKEMIISFEEYKSNYPDNSHCVLEKIKLFANQIYSLYIIKYHKQLNQKDIFEFDQWLRVNYVNIYNEFDNCVYSEKYNLNIIKKWRKKDISISILRIAVYIWHCIKGS